MSKETVPEYSKIKTKPTMSDILAIDYSLMTTSLSDEEIGLLQEYQNLASNLNSVKGKLEEINNQLSCVSLDNLSNLTTLSTELQKALGILGTVFKSTVHNVLLQVDSNQVATDEAANRTMGSLADEKEAGDREAGESQGRPEAQRNMEQQPDGVDGGNAHAAAGIAGYGSNGGTPKENNAGLENDEEDDDDDDVVDLSSGIDEETMNAVDRIQHELGISADDVDIHRQIADQLEIENTDDY